MSASAAASTVGLHDRNCVDFLADAPPRPPRPSFLPSQAARAAAQAAQQAAQEARDAAMAHLPDLPAITGAPMTPAEHLARRHPRPFGCVSLAVITGGYWNEKALRRDIAEGVADIYEGVDDVYATMQPMGGWRCGQMVLALRSSYLDLDTYREPRLAGLTPSDVTRLLLARCDALGLPPPTIMDTGRGLSAEWNYPDVPTRALKRWSAVQRHLIAAFQDFAADPAVSDPTRVLRLAGTVNSKSGRVVAPTYLGPRTTFDALANAILPWSRHEIQNMRAAKKARKMARNEAARLRAEAKVAASAPGAAPAARPELTRATWGETLLADLKKLHAHRHRGGAVPVGGRDLFLFCVSIAVAHAATPSRAAQMVEEMARLVGWSGSKGVAKMRTALDKAKAAFAGKKVRYRDRLVDPRYTPSASTVCEWLRITPDEAREADLRILVPSVVRGERNRTRAHDIRRRKGMALREEYLSAADDRAARAAELKALGMTWREVAADMGLPSWDAARQLAKRARLYQDEAAGTPTPPDNSDLVSSGVSPALAAALARVDAAPALVTVSGGEVASPLAPRGRIATPRVRSASPPKPRKPRLVPEVSDAAPVALAVLSEAQRLAALVSDYKRHAALMSKPRVLPFFPPRPAEYVAAPGVWRNWQGAADMDIPEVRSAWKAAMAATVKARARPAQRAARIERELARAERLALFAGWAAAGDGRAYRAYLAERGAFWDAVQDSARDQDRETRRRLAMQRGNAFKHIRHDWDEAVRKAAADRPALRNAERFRTVPDATDLRAMSCVPPITHQGTGTRH